MKRYNKVEVDNRGIYTAITTDGVEVYITGNEDSSSVNIIVGPVKYTLFTLISWNVCELTIRTERMSGFVDMKTITNSDMVHAVVGGFAKDINNLVKRFEKRFGNIANPMAILNS